MDLQGCLGIPLGQSLGSLFFRSDLVVIEGISDRQPERKIRTGFLPWLTVIDREKPSPPVDESLPIEGGGARVT